MQQKPEPAAQYQKNDRADQDFKEAESAIFYRGFTKTKSLHEPFLEEIYLIVLRQDLY